MSKYNEQLTSQISESAKVLSSLGDGAQVQVIEKIIETLICVIKSGGTIYACGNGGSACEAMHFTEELVARYRKHRPGIRAQHLQDPGTITCWANDYNFETVFQRQVETFLNRKDALVVLSTSGNSPNIINALNACNKIGAHSIAFLGKDGGKAKSLSTTPLIIKSENTPRIQEAHLALIHIICEQLENALFPAPLSKPAP